LILTQKTQNLSQSSQIGVAVYFIHTACLLFFCALSIAMAVTVPVPVPVLAIVVAMAANVSATVPVVIATSAARVWMRGARAGG
jgi:hypothetical protein